MTKAERDRKHNLKRKYRLKVSEYKQLSQEQLGCCAICGTSKPGGRYRILQVDHNHQTGKVRGLLCHNCNRGLGYFKDDPKRIRAALKYLGASLS